MSSGTHGTNTSHNEVTNISSVGFWIIVDEIEYFIPFADYPVFKDSTVKQIFNVKSLSPTQIHWPDLDADIEIEALENPERYPLVWKELKNR